MPEDRQGTGKHPHKSTEEPYPHTKGSNEGKSEHRQEAKSERSENRSESRSEDRSEQQDLKEREYRDEQGNVHHHTRTFEEQHGKEGGGKKAA